MSLVIDHTLDYLFLCNIQEVTLTDRGTVTRAKDGTVTETGNDDVTIENALKRFVTIQEIEDSGGLLKRGDVRWWLPIDQVGSAQLRNGDRILDGDTVTWTIMDAEEKVFRSWWRCICRKV